MKIIMIKKQKKKYESRQDEILYQQILMFRYLLLLNPTIMFTLQAYYNSQKTFTICRIQDMLLLTEITQIRQQEVYIQNLLKLNKNK